MSHHPLPHLDLLDYALEGAVMRRGTLSGILSESEQDLLDRDIAEIERRIERAKNPKPPSVGLVGRLDMALQRAKKVGAA